MEGFTNQDGASDCWIDIDTPLTSLIRWWLYNGTFMMISHSLKMTYILALFMSGPQTGNLKISKDEWINLCQESSHHSPQEKMKRLASHWLASHCLPVSFVFSSYPTETHGLNMRMFKRVSCRSLKQPLNLRKADRVLQCDGPIDSYIDSYLPKPEKRHCLLISDYVPLGQKQMQ